MAIARRPRPPFIWLIIITCILWLVMVMPPTVLVSWLTTTKITQVLFWSLLVGPVLTIWAWQIIGGSSTLARWLTMQYLGMSALLLPFILPGAIATLFFDSFAVGLTVSTLWLLAVVVSVYSVTRIREQKLSFDSPKLDRPYRLVQISDVHIGSRSTRFLSQIVKQLSNHSPDAVVITGDLLDLEHIDEQHLAPLQNIECPVYLCLGNHECYVDLDKAINAIEVNSVNVLRNRSMILGALQIHGVDDQNDVAEVKRLLDTMARDQNLYQILLYHRPDGWHAALDTGIDLMLAGHTHGGQIWPFGLLVKRQFKQMAGYFNEHNQHLYVSSGTGTWGPTFRLGTRSEMTVIELVPIGISSAAKL